MQPRDPNYRQRVEAIFAEAAFMRELGVDLDDLGPGWCETRLAVRPAHFQQNQVVHAGVIATMADHTAGAAAGTLCSDDEVVLTIEYKINFLRPAIAASLHCRSEVLKAGQMVTICESSVRSGDKAKLISKAIVTLANVRHFK